MSLKAKNELIAQKSSTIELSKSKDQLFSKDYSDFFSEAGWRLEKKLP